MTDFLKHAYPRKILAARTRPSLQNGHAPSEPWGRTMRDVDKPPVLRQPRRLLRLLLVLFVVLGIVYAATALTGFLRNQTKDPDPRMTGAEAPLEPSA